MWTMWSCSYELSPAKPPKVQMQTPQLIIAVSRLEQQPEFLPGENRIKQAQGCRNSRLLRWDSHIPTRATVGAQKKFLGLQVFFFLCNAFFHLAVCFLWSQKVSCFVSSLFFWNQQKKLGASFCPRHCTETRKGLCPAERKSAYEQIK